MNSGAIEKKLTTEKLVGEGFRSEKIDLPGENLSVVALPDRDGQTVTLPIRTGECNLEDLGKLKIVELKPVEIDEESRLYLGEAVIRLPYLLAVHATFNCDPRPDLNNFVDGGGLVPILGIEAPPHSGKTALLLVDAVANDDSVLGVRDLDPFSPEALSNCLNDIKEIIGQEVNKDRISLLIDTVLKVYAEKRKDGIRQDTSRITLKEKLDDLLNEFRQPNHRQAYILDLPGKHDHEFKTDIFDFLGSGLPNINLEEAIKFYPELEQCLKPNSLTPIYERFGHPAAYIMMLRRRIYDPVNQDNPETLFNKAKSQHYFWQLNLVQTLGRG